MKLLELGLEFEITAVELDPELARLYQERFPNDKVIVADAHQYLLDHYRNMILFGLLHLAQLIVEQDIGVLE